MNNKIFVVVNVDWFFLSHRKEIAKAAIKEGYDVTLIAQDTGKRHIIEAMGIHFIDFPVDPVGTNPIHEFYTLWWLYCIFRREQPDIVHLVGLKCMLWGSIAARFAHIKKVINAVSGLGITFSSPQLGWTAKCILAGLRWANRPGMLFLFQNKDDQTLFIKHNVVHIDQCRFAKGSGINLQDYTYTPEQSTNKLHVIFTGRMIREKGVCDLIAAAEILRPDYGKKVEFWLCGGLHDNPKALQEDELQSMCDGQYIQWRGFCSNIKELLQQSHIVAFPSYYREGVPKSLIEACAIGRPIITCDTVGCRDVVEDGINGFLVQPHSPNNIADRLRLLLENKTLRDQMGKSSREFAERDFAIEKVVQIHINMYNE